MILLMMITTITSTHLASEDSTAQLFITTIMILGIPTIIGTAMILIIMELQSM